MKKKMNMTPSYSSKSIRLDVIKSEHKKYLWDILKETIDYFDDRVQGRTMDEFFLTIIDGLVGIKSTDEVVGCAYLSDICNGLAEINIFTKRHSIEPNELLRLIKYNMRYFFDRHNLLMLYAVTQPDNRACIKLLQRSGFHWSMTLKDHEVIRGNKVDGEMYVILREEVV
jgi:hypothetical protein